MYVVSTVTLIYLLYRILGQSPRRRFIFVTFSCSIFKFYIACPVCYNQLSCLENLVGESEINFIERNVFEKQTCFHNSIS